MRWRTPLAAIAILVFLAIYVALASLLADLLPDIFWLVAIYYCVAGIVWLPMVLWIMGWARQDPEPPEEGRR
jgi:hypothetical protein